MKSTIIIPARYGSSRYKGKPLVKILGREMILRVADICSKAVSKKNLYIATDNKKIANLITKENLNVVMTSSKCLTGTDRVAEAAKKIKSNIYVNVQGDEPTINPKDIKKIIKAKIKYPNHVICGYDMIPNSENPSDINFPKVVINKNDELIYISRSLVPGVKTKKKGIKYFRQVCIYAFNKRQLDIFYKKKKKSHIESLEDIEILRFFEHDIKIKMIRLYSSSVAVDIPEDVKRAERYIKKNFILEK
tara:strand:+ start:212 stop:955 length:744 start_codon:yes stop_codon:yes gene_type:complete